jgi:2-polyprenyl-6-methoxyphenol hydroxylase-like FAD-dependent oxidoreductase
VKAKAIIIGSGIGGLATAIALKRVGWEVEVLERARELGEVGAGLSLWKNALAALDRLGLLESLRALGVEGQTGGFRTPSGEILFEMREGTTDSATGTASRGIILLLHRAELLDVLHRAAGPDLVRLGANCIGLDQDAATVTARFDDGRVARGDLLIGADGLKSVVRSCLFGSQPPRYGGYTAWRAVTRFEQSRLTPGETWGRGRRFGQWGMTDGRAYWYATETVAEGQSDPPEGRKQGLLNLFRGWHKPVEDLIAATDESAILRNDVYDRPVLRHWTVGRATLLGDAAHPMTPDMGQGACQAIEDAVVLADCLSRSSNIDEALRAYEFRRIPRTRRVVHESRQAGTIAQWSNPVACRFREALLRSRFVARVQASQLEWMIRPQV